MLHRICAHDRQVFSPIAESLSFLAVFEDLGLQEGYDGWVVRHAAGDLRPRPHRHAELELNLVVQGTASYLLAEHRYELTAGTLLWLFPDQEHVLVDESADHVLWWAVFRPEVVARMATASHARSLLERDPAGRCTRRIEIRDVRRLASLFGELGEAAAVDDTLFNAGLTYLLASAWRAFVDSENIVGGRGVHPAVDAVARLVQADPGAGDLTELARRVGLSPSHLSRLFSAQMGVSISRFRNQQRLHRFMSLFGDGRGTTALGAAHAAGFGSYAQFHRVFRRETGRTPSDLPAGSAHPEA